MLHIGITGGIGSGKSTVCHLFSLFDIPVYKADQRAKWLMENNEYLRESIRDAFGNEAFLPTGQLNRSYLAEIVFSDQKRLRELNQLVHPVVFKDTQEWQKKQSASYSIRESALLFESGYYHYVDICVVVSAPRETRIERIQNRDGLKRNEIIARMDNQLPEEEKRQRADYIIENDGESLLIPQVVKLHKTFLQLAKDKTESHFPDEAE